MSLSELYAGIAGNDINLCRKYICEQLSDQYCGKPRGRYKTDGNTADSICNERTSYDVVVFQAGWQMFSVKALGYLVCGSISFLYVVQMLQMLSFALCLPSAVYYVNETMAVEDRVKGQSLLIASSTMGGVFGSLSGGVLVDFAGIKAMLATGLGLSMIGTAIVCIFVSRKDN